MAWGGWVVIKHNSRLRVKARKVPGIGTATPQEADPEGEAASDINRACTGHAAAATGGAQRTAGRAERGKARPLSAGGLIMGKPAARSQTAASNTRQAQSEPAPRPGCITALTPPRAPARRSPRDAPSAAKRLARRVPASRPARARARALCAAAACCPPPASRLRSQSESQRRRQRQPARARESPRELTHSALAAPPAAVMGLIIHAGAAHLTRPRSQRCSPAVSFRWCWPGWCCLPDACALPGPASAPPRREARLSS